DRARSRGTGVRLGRSGHCASVESYARRVTSVRDEPASIGQRVLWQMDHHRGGHGAGLDERGVELGRLAMAEADVDPKRASFLTTLLGRHLWTAGQGDAALIAYHEAVSFV